VLILLTHQLYVGVGKDTPQSTMVTASVTDH
jgi:hypothetical protein